MAPQLGAASSHHLVELDTVEGLAPGEMGIGGDGTNRDPFVHLGQGFRRWAVHFDFLVEIMIR